MQSKSLDRRADIDWLRVFATYLLFVFHGALIFSPAPFFHVRNADVTPFMMILTGFISLWHMPLFFVLAGWSAHASVALRGAGRFIRERVLRLALPLVVGCATIGPILKFFELKSGLDLNHKGLWVAAELQDSFKTAVPQGLPVAQPFTDNFWTFLPSFYTSLDRFTWGHLWFLAYLFVFSLLYLPFFSRALRRPSRVEPLRSAVVYLPVVPLAVIQVVLRPYWPGVQNLYDDWANFAYYSTFFVLGFLLAHHPGFEAAVVRERKRALVASVGVMLMLLLALLRVFESDTILLAGSAAAGWCFIVAMLGYARTLLADVHAGIRYLRESALPVYILHQPALVIIGYFVVGTSMGIAAKYLTIVVASVLAVQSLYHLVVRHSPLLRVLYGMRPAPDVSVPRLAQPISAALLIALSAGDASGASVTGTWWIEGGAAKVEIADCGESVCGRVAWLRSPFDEYGCELRDVHNPEPRLRQRPLLGLRVLESLRAENGVPDRWTGGNIYDPESGRTYRCSLTLDEPHALELRGFVGIPLIGRTTRWIRAGSEHEQCRMRSELARPGEHGNR